MIQVIVDNHDTNMNTLNGKQTTHALAMLITQAENVSVMGVPLNEYEENKDVMNYACLTKSPMFDIPAINETDRFKIRGHISEARAKELD